MRAVTGRALARNARTITTRPGQPFRLNAIDKGPEAIPVPGSIFTREAERLGQIDVAAIEGSSTIGQLSPRPVPKTQDDFEAEKLRYKRQLAAVRKGIIAEVQAHDRRVAAASAEYRARVAEQKAEARALKAVEKAARASAAEAEGARVREARRLKADLGARKVQLRLSRVEEARTEWLKALVADAAARWVPEDRIDEMITPELFGLKYAWQYGKWFEAKDKKKRLVEAARRAKRPGVPLKEVFLEGSDAEYEEDWESEDEVAEGEGAGVATERPFGAAEADEDAAEDPTGLTAAALAVARSAASRGGLHFPEPSYDKEGRPLDETGDRVARMRAAQGITPQELGWQMSAEQAYRRYEEWVAQEHRSQQEKEQQAAQGGAGAGSEAVSVSSSSSSFSSSASSSSVIDDGEREAENAYLRALIMGSYAPQSTSVVSRWTNSRQIGRGSGGGGEDGGGDRGIGPAAEALYYALIRKRRRLEKGGALYAAALAKLDNIWGPWLAEVDAVAFGAPQLASTGGSSAGLVTGGSGGAATNVVLTPAQQAARQRAAEQEAANRKSLEELQATLLSSVGVKPTGSAGASSEGSGGVAGGAGAAADAQSAVANLFAELQKQMQQPTKQQQQQQQKPSKDEEEGGTEVSDANLVHAARLKEAAGAVPLPRAAVEEAAAAAAEDEKNKGKK